jgi:hypothetical protein
MNKNIENSWKFVPRYSENVGCLRLIALYTPQIESNDVSRTRIRIGMGSLSAYIIGKYRRPPFPTT